MNEEEIIKKANEFINTLNEIIYDESDWYDYEELESAKEQLPVMKGLLELYNNLKEIEEEHRKLNGELRVELEQEKEKNKEYIENTELLKKYIRENYISKDKIREKIKDLEENNNGDDYSLINVINILKELLEEG